MTKNKYKQIIEKLDDISNKQKADIYQRKYLKEKQLNNKIRKIVGL